MEPGVRVFTTGVALNPLDPRGDAAVHLKDDSGPITAYLRAVDVEGPAITPGDSVRLRGRTALEAGFPILEDVQAFIVSQEPVGPDPLDRSTEAAAGADDGALNAALVRIQGAEILDTTRVDGHLVATVDDGSGPLELVLRDFLGFNESAFSPGFARVVEATGLLVALQEPGEPLRWRLVPRFPGDVTVESYPSLTLDVIRGLAAGQGVTAHGIVLNPVDRPVPGTIHLYDARVGFYIRVRDVSGVSPSPGDSIRVRAETARDVRQPVLDAIRFTVLESGAEPNLPQPPVETTAAFTAGDFGLDAALVRVQSAEVISTGTVDDHFVATIDDGSGAVEMMVRSSVNFDTSQLTSGTVLEEAVGVLVPYFFEGAFPRWRILPRFGSDIQVAP